MTMNEIRSMPPDLDEAKLDAASEDDLRRYRIADGFDPDRKPKRWQVVIAPQDIRKSLGMTQEEFAEALCIPVATLRNWEQGRVIPDPAARSLLTIVARDPKAAFAALIA